MEFLYDVTAEETADAVKVTKHDDKTDDAFHKFEDQVDEQIQKTSKAILNLVKEKDSLNFQIPDKLGGTVSTKAQEMLGKLDDSLEKVEELTHGYWKTVSNKSFWSSMANTISTQFQEVPDLHAKDSESPGKANTSDSITENRLQQLSIDKTIYLQYDTATLPKNFVIKEHTDEIQQLLSKDSDLKNLRDSVVFADLTEEIFWNIFFTKRTEILNLANKKRELLSVKDDVGKEQAVGWDDEEEDSEEEIIPSTTPKSKKESNDSDTEVKAATKVGSHGEKQEEQQEEDDDDDWE
ncbi:unnamed protein product [Kluyveromyces dobzhanskii CBS 2104]|uniref:WGS project CCBQ000000000 data, contig 00014 n=1 Tax=Kluyveromyces dobzhanskii CBS 2104 TaxID=1427455 RepID=A0A0A8L6F9_9SACH|nr:unnamed protein product [Kluyveromyces dobzhanskii CBS 2104]